MLWEKLRAWFGSRAVSPADLERVRLRLDRLETAPRTDEVLDELRNAIAGAEAVRDGLGARIVQLETDLDVIVDERKDLILAISDGIERTDRAERRIKATVKRARKELLSRGYVDPGLEAEGFELRELDGEGSDESELRPVQPSLGIVEDETSSIRGVSLAALRRARGF